MLRHLGSHLAIAAGLAVNFAAFTAHAETSSSSPSSSSNGESNQLDFNPNPVVQKRAEEPKDRKDEAKDASNKAAQSVPPLLGKAAEHMKNAKDHNDKASQLQQSNPGQAEQERKKAALEQQMANQLQQQANQNKKNADDNQKSSDAAKSEEKVKGKSYGGTEKISSKVDENKVIMVDEARQNGDSQLGAKTPKAEETDPLKKELATFEDYVPVNRPIVEATPATEAAPASGAESGGEQTSFLKPEWNSMLTGGGNSPGGPPGPGPATPPTDAGTAVSAPAPANGASASTTTGGGFGAATPTILAAAGDTPGKGLDKDFFKEKKDKKGKKKKIAGRALASKWKDLKIRRVEAELEADAAPPLLDGQPTAPLPKSGKLKD